MHLYVPASMPEIERLLTVRDVAERLNVKTRWVYEHAESGYLPRLNKTRSIRFNSRVLDTWLESRLRGSAGDVPHDGSCLLTTEDLLSYTGFSRSWVYEARRSQGLPHYKLDAHLRFSRPLVDAWLAERAEIHNQT